MTPEPPQEWINWSRLMGHAHVRNRFHIRLAGLGEEYQISGVDVFLFNCESPWVARLPGRVSKQVTPCTR